MSIDKKLNKALIASISGRYLVYVTQVISMVVMARLFTPENFGIFAAVQVFAIFFTLLSEMGLGPALINQKTVNNEMRDGVFSLTLIIGACLALIFGLSGSIISSFYDNEIYNLLVIPIAISIIFNTTAIVPLASFQKDKRFISIARCEGIAELLSLGMVLIQIQYFEPIWVLSLKPLTVAILRCFLLWITSQKTFVGRAKFGRDLGQVRVLLAFSMYQFGFSVVNYFSRNLDNILVGKYFSSISLGVYDQAYRLMRYPLMLLTFAMAPAIQPVLTELKDDPYEFERLHNKFVTFISILGLVVGISVYFLADLIVSILLGEQWGDVIPLLEILSLTIPIQIVLSSSGGFFQAAGRADLLFKSGVLSTIVNVTAVIIGINHGTLEGLCWSLLVSFSINFIQTYFILSKYLLPNGFIHFLKKISVSILGTAIFITWAYTH